MIKHTLLPFLLFALLRLDVATAQMTVPRPSPNAAVSQFIGITEVNVKYSRPGVKGRQIWGGLVPWDKVWRTGANEATNFKTTDDILVEGKKLPAGSYSLATIPGKDSWTVIFNKRDDLWGAAGYKQEEDALRVTVKPQAAPHQEWMHLSFADLSDNTATLMFHWEKVQIPIRLEIDTRERTLAKARQVIDWRPAMTAANYCLQNDTNPEEAMKWIDISMMIEKNYWNSRVKAQLLAKAGKKKDAIALMDEAIAMGGKMNNAPFDFETMKKLLAEWKQ